MGFYEKMFFGGKAFRPENMKPDIYVESLNDVSSAWLKERQIRLVLLDVDQTCATYHGSSIDEKVAEAVDRLKSGFHVYLVSNSSQERLKKLPELFGIPCIAEGRNKPYPDKLFHAMKAVEATPRQTVMIGDRILMDVYAARNAGACAILVRPLDPKSDPLGIKIVRGIEGLLALEQNS